MKLGVNSGVNFEQHPVGIKHNLGTSKVQLTHTDTFFDTFFKVGRGK